MKRAKASDAEKIKKYFGGAGRVLPWLLIILGMPLLALFFVGAIFIGVGIWLLSRSSAPIADAKVDAWTDYVLGRHDFIARAEELSGFEDRDLVYDPILLTGFAVDADVGDVFTGERFGDDGEYRMTPMAATVLLATHEQVGIYQTGVDLITGNRVNERFLEVFYQDVVAVTVMSRSVGLDLKEMVQNVRGGVSVNDQHKGLTAKKVQKNAAKLRLKYRDSLVADIILLERSKIYQIDLADGQHIRIAVRDGRETAFANGQPFVSQDDYTARAMYAFRLFVREKKRGFLREDVSG